MKNMCEAQQGSARYPAAVPRLKRAPRLTAARMYSILLAGDANYDGRFFTGVLTTGIYCLPSCKARKPRADNVRFFPNVEAARAAGLRPCRKCHPDDFALGADPVLDCIETLVSELRKQPAAFPDTDAIVRRSGFGATRCFELFRQHYHATPADLLLRARLDLTKRLLLQSNDSLAAIAAEAGFEGLSTFYEHFRRYNGLTPAAYRDLREGRRFQLSLPRGYPLPYLRRALGRDKKSLVERLEGDVYVAGLSLDAGPAVLTLRLASDHVEAELSNGSASEAHQVVVGLLGLDQDVEGFSRTVQRLQWFQLIAGRDQLRISQTHSLFEGLLWAIIGQQINFPFACTLKRRLVEEVGTPLENGLYAPPTPEQVATLSVKALLNLQFSRQKAEYVLNLAGMVAQGTLDLTALRTLSATRVARTLSDIHGFGPWSVNYVMMRSLGFADCVPLGDTGVSSGLQALLQLQARPDPVEVKKLMASFAPFRSLATAHLWQFKQPVPV